MGKVTIAGARVSKGWSQQELADKMGVSRKTVQKWESGELVMRTAYFYMLCGITGFSKDDFSLPYSTQNEHETEEGGE